MKLCNYDQRIHFYKLKMHRSTLDDIPCAALPEGYAFCFYKENDRDAWIQIQMAAGVFAFYEDGLNVWNQYFQPYEDQLPSRMVFIQDETGKKVANASAYFDIHGLDPNDSGRLHWVAVHHDFQGKKLSRPLISYTLTQLKNLGYTHAYLSTQTASWVACRLYLDFGFVPEQSNALSCRQGWNIIRSLTLHPSLSMFEELPFDKILKKEK